MKGRSTGRIIVHSHSADPTEIAEAIEAAFPDRGEVWAVRSKSTKQFFMLFEVFRVFLEGVREAADLVLIDAIAGIMIAYFRRRFDSGMNNRPKYGAILGPDGKVVKSFVLKKRDGEPEDKTEEDRQHPPMAPPDTPLEGEESEE